jgi:hypothetical protein
MRTALFSLLLLLGFQVSIAQSGSPEAQIEQFQQQLCSNVEQVITNYIEPLTADPDVRENFRNQFAFLRDNYGGCNGFETFEVKEFSPSVHLYKCFFKYERTPVVFKFIFYKYEDVWQLNSVRFSDSLGEELSE